jgi:hypothetical protein
MFDLKEKEQISQRIVKEGQEQDIQIYINLNQNQCDMGTKKTRKFTNAVTIPCYIPNVTNQRLEWRSRIRVMKSASCKCN